MGNLHYTFSRPDARLASPAYTASRTAYDYVPATLVPVLAALGTLITTAYPVTHNRFSDSPLAARSSSRAAHLPRNSWR